jgi:hypothetical protein
MPEANLAGTHKEAAGAVLETSVGLARGRAFVCACIHV